MGGPQALVVTPSTGGPSATRQWTEPSAPLLLNTLAIVPNLGGRIAEMIWGASVQWIEVGQQTQSRAALDLLRLLLASHSVQIALVVGIKERRADLLCPVRLCGPG